MFRHRRRRRAQINSSVTGRACGSWLWCTAGTDARWSSHALRRTRAIWKRLLLRQARLRLLDPPDGCGRRLKRSWDVRTRLSSAVALLCDGLFIGAVTRTCWYVLIATADNKMDNSGIYRQRNGQFSRICGNQRANGHAAATHLIL